MKTLLLLALSSLFTSTLAFTPGWGEPAPACDSLEARLSKRPITCTGNPPFAPDFELPEQQLNLEELEKIFQGAESSGGRQVGPMSTPRMDTDLTPFPLHFQCEARLLADGKKKVSFLSTQKFPLTESNYKKDLSVNSWSHSLIFGTDINTEESGRTFVTVSPALEIPLYDLRLSYRSTPKGADILGLEVCEKEREEGKEVLTCGFSEFKALKKAVGKTTMKKYLREWPLHVDLTLQVECRRF